MKLTKLTAAAVLGLTVAGVVAVPAATVAHALTAPAPGVAQPDTFNPDVIDSGSINAMFASKAKSYGVLDQLLNMVANNNAANALGEVAIYRMYNPNSGEHMYSNSLYEAASLLISGWTYEGVLGYSATGSGVGVQRLYNPNSGLHYYTASAYEAQYLIAQGWTDEGTLALDGLNTQTTPATGTPASSWANLTALLPVYVAYNSTSGQHNFTSSQYEESVLVGNGWQSNGTASSIAFSLVQPGLTMAQTAGN